MLSFCLSVLGSLTFTTSFTMLLKRYYLKFSLTFLQILYDLSSDVFLWPKIFMSSRNSHPMSFMTSDAIIPYDLLLPDPCDLIILWPLWLLTGKYNHLHDLGSHGHCDLSSHVPPDLMALTSFQYMFLMTFLPVWCHYTSPMQWGVF